MPTPNATLTQNQYSEQEILNKSFDKDFKTLVMQALGYDGQALQRLNASNLTTQMDYVSGSNPIYIGTAAPGTATSTAKWKITKLTYDASDNLTAIAYAAGTPNFDQIWDNRASLSYS